MNRKKFMALSGAAALAAMAGTPLLARQAPRKNWVWVRGDFSSMEIWKPQFARWRAAGIDAILPNTGDAETLRRIIPAARAEGLETHAWIFTMMRGGMEAEHPEWYAVNRRGQSTATDPPYVDYYRFLCPSRAPVRQHIAAHVAELAAIPDLESVHLDYVRYPDVILPRALWAQYDLVQDVEHPEFDYCYCDECRAQFRAQTGADPTELADPTADARWRQFRYDSITRVVAELAAVTRPAGKQLTAAVFPTPGIARALVRQDWPRWDLDAALPMLYHNFYEHPVEWIEAGTREGVEALAGRYPMYAGLYVPELDPQALGRAVRAALAGGAAGVALFESQVPTEQHWKILAETL
jgi:uncharacterized lipoprotein YddW (UPF0748 family)